MRHHITIVLPVAFWPQGTSPSPAPGSPSQARYDAAMPYTAFSKRRLAVPGAIAVGILRVHELAFPPQKVIKKNICETESGAHPLGAEIIIKNFYIKLTCFGGLLSVGLFLNIPHIFD